MKALMKSAQNCEMDIMVHFWDDERDQVKVRYLGSSFFRHGKTVNLVDEFGKITNHLDHKTLYQISMDGPYVNLKFLKEISKMREESLFHRLIDIGTCSLHSVHGSLKTGFEKSSMNIKKIL